MRWCKWACLLWIVAIVLGGVLTACTSDRLATPGPYDAGSPDAVATAPPPDAGGGVAIPAPTHVSAIAGDGVASLAWESAVADAVSFTIVGQPGGVTMTADSTSAEMTGLTNGVAYRFTVSVRTPHGESPPSEPSNEVTPAGAPGAPAGVAATAGNGEATLTWTPPSNSGSPILDYKVTANPGGLVLTTRASTLVFPGLVNGTSYTFVVAATNEIGDGPASLPSNAVVPVPPANAPDAPINVVATASAGAASVTWPAPNDKGFPITGYTVRSNPDGRTATGTTTTLSVTGLSNGQTYTFTVTATNVNGTSLPSAASNAVTPIGPPGAPTGVLAVRGNKSASVTWMVPNAGGHPITGYKVTSNPGGVVIASTAPSTTVDGLTNGTSYTFTVVATNDLGDGPPSTPSNAVTPAIAPDAPTAVVVAPGNGAASVSWTAPNDNGAPITGYDVVTMPGGGITHANGTRVTVGGLTNGSAYTFTVKATNSVGASVASAPSSPAVPDTCVQTTYIVTNPGNGYVFSGAVGLNPVITICRGKTYTFHLDNVDGHPFALLDNGFGFHGGVTNNGAEGTTDIVWDVSMSEPPGGRYTCLIHPPMTNTFELH